MALACVTMEWWLSTASCGRTWRADLDEKCAVWEGFVVDTGDRGRRSSGGTTVESVVNGMVEGEALGVDTLRKEGRAGCDGGLEGRSCARKERIGGGGSVMYVV